MTGLAANPVREENHRPGTTEWLLRKPYPRPHAGVRSAVVEGFCSRPSVCAGERLAIFVSTDPPAQATIDIFRTGYYGGAGGRRVMTLGPVPCPSQPVPTEGPQRVRACDWEPSVDLEVPADWLSGVYVGKLTETAHGYESYVVFVVTDRRRADLLFHCADLTWQAYNHWPDLYSLYTDGYRSWYNGPGVAVSFRRPYGRYIQLVDSALTAGAGEWFLWEFPFAYWMEAHGFDVTYESGLDLHVGSSPLLRVNGFLSVGHDEYYTLQMFHRLRAAIDDGMNAGFFCGNSIGHVVDIVDDERLAFHRVDTFGRRTPELLAAFPDLAAFPWNAPAANDLMGSGLAYPIVGGADWICADAAHWAFDGTGMADGDPIPGLVGWEFHGDPAAIPGLAVIATGRTEHRDRDGSLREGEYAATCYEAAQGNVVFNAATCWWSDGLSAPPGYVRSPQLVARSGPDHRVQRITINVLERLRERRWRGTVAV
jgi:hypothetical protein